MRVIILLLFATVAMADELTINQIDQKMSAYEAEVQAKRAEAEKIREVRKCLIENDVLKDTLYMAANTNYRKYLKAMDDLERLYDVRKVTQEEYTSTLSALREEMRQYQEAEKLRYETLKTENKTLCPER